VAAPLKPLVPGGGEINKDLLTAQAEAEKLQKEARESLDLPTPLDEQLQVSDATLTRMEQMRKATEAARKEAGLFGMTFKELGESLVDSVAGGLASVWWDFIDGTKKAKEAVADFAINTLRWLTQIIFKQMLLKAIGGIFGLDEKTDGGPVQKKAAGGTITGGSGLKDDVHILATAGEFMQPVRSVKYYGLPVMEALRRQLVPRNLFARMGFSVPPLPSRGRRHFATGGEIGPAGTGNVTVNLVNKSETPLQVTSAKPEMNRLGEWVLNVVIDAADRNRGGFRDIMQGALAR
jgi:hypothetical protein